MSAARKKNALTIDRPGPSSRVGARKRTKWIVEQILEDYDRAYDFKSTSLRYFNTAGADPAGQLGERHEPETHLMNSAEVEPGVV